MTTFKPWEYRAEAGFVEGTDLTGYTVVAVDGDLGHVEAEYDSRPAYLEVDVGSLAFRPQRDVAGRSRGADRRNGEEGVRRPYEGPDRARAQVSTRRSPTTSTIGNAWVVTTPARTCRRVVRCDLSPWTGGEDWGARQRCRCTSKAGGKAPSALSLAHLAVRTLRRRR